MPKNGPVEGLLRRLLQFESDSIPKSNKLARQIQLENKKSTLMVLIFLLKYFIISCCFCFVCVFFFIFRHIIFHNLFGYNIFVAEAIS